MKRTNKRTNVKTNDKRQNRKPRLTRRELFDAVEREMMRTANRDARDEIAFESHDLKIERL